MRMELTVLVGALMASACVSSDVVRCGADVTCPAGDTCITLGGQSACATPAQIAACDGLAEGAACALEGVSASSCVSSACFATVCGDGRMDAAEACDDGNTQPGDGCSSDCRSTEICGNGVVDPLQVVNGQAEVNELCDDGNLLSGDGCSSACAVESPKWSLLDQTIPPLTAHRMSYDTARRQLVLFGGGIETPNGSTSVNGTYEWDGARWFTRETIVAPAARDHAQLAYDPVRHRTLLFGGAPSGQYSAAFGDTWEWDGTSWWIRAPAHHPSPRAAGTLVYDGAHKRMVLFGGRGPIDGVDTTFDETWTWDGQDWTQLTAGTHPSKRGHHVGGYDPTRGVVVIAGGDVYTSGENDSYPEDTWELDGDTWSPRGASPPSLALNAAMAWDPVGQRLITYGGVTKNGDSTPTMSAYTAQGWTPLSDTTPGPLLDPGLASDPVNGQVIMYGGTGNGIVGDTWSWDGSAWSLLPPPSAPSHRGFAAGASDPATGRMFVFGGNDETDTASNTLLIFDGSTWSSPTNTGTPPTARIAGSTAYDPAHDRLVVFGGTTNSGSSPADTFVWNGTWTKYTTDPAPSPRAFAAMAYDARNQRVVLYGGIDDASQILDDTWAWDGSQWQQLVTASSPGGLRAPVLVYDSARGTLLAAGGTDVWQLDGLTWTRLDAASPLPGRIAAGEAYDAVAHSLVVQGGFPFSEPPLADTWEWNGAWTYVATSTTPAARASQVMVSNPNGPGVLSFGGRTGLLGLYSTNYADTWSLAWVSSTARESCVTDVDLDKDGLAGCDDPDCWYACTPLCTPGAVGCDSSASKCGDGTCNTAHENCRICPDDCTCGAAVCGDNVCDTSESATSCPGDCTP